ncbi:aromatic ring-hydroxylating dioxygenase subunit alpha [Pseudomonas marginalis]|uniref:Aromatic ring-hydroxylating dioxygenase subunit alpha n=1 Tax=Pseudomonas marginalis TaxID=298 RepID=A0A9X9BPQ6_PSEMA|nr:aromatic ring-hydroxylating dioxygenase subunit alpha [Pseudomonas marginalis]TWR56159.1 aromatic ring-hydroxylating dioxygenase subunit alpha [Pseudomonas marginalis]SEB61991.1 Rieske [2Fe-2S] domain-containing protein [Pseudomonas marginalis]
MKSRDANTPYDPMTWEVWNGAGPGSSDEKYPHPHGLYPELAEYRRLDTQGYTDPKVVDQEWQRLWTQTWTCAGRVSDLPKLGSWFRYDLGKESFIITRGHDDQIRALYNVCQHRGRRLVDADRGQGLKFVCPFHSWAYDSTGKNVRVTDRQMFDEQTLCGEVNLSSVRCETWAGFVFISMNPQAPTLLDFLGDVTRLMEPYQMEDMHVVRDVVLSMNCNWKIGLEAFLESYHLHATHPQAMPVTEDYLGQFDVFENGHARHATALAIPSVRLKDQTTVNPLLQFLLKDSGIDPTSYSGTAADVRNAICDAKRNPDNHFGLNYSRFTDSQITDDWNYFVFPNMTFNSHPEGILIMRFLPHPTDPGQFQYHVLVIMPKLKEGAAAPFYMGVEEGDDITGATRPERIHSSTEVPRLGEILEQDISNIQAVQQGLQSKGFAEGMRLGEQELRIQVFHAELDRYLKGGKFQAAGTPP